MAETLAALIHPSRQARSQFSRATARSIGWSAASPHDQIDWGSQVQHSTVEQSHACGSIPQFLLAAPGVVATAFVIVNGVKLFLRPKRAGDIHSIASTTDGSIPASPSVVVVSKTAHVAAAGPIRRIFTSKYIKLGHLGKGTFGEVFQGMDNETGEVVAIKEMPSTGAEMLRKEFELLQGLSHPHVVVVHGFEIHGQKARLYLEWVANGSLDAMRQRCGTIPEARLKVYARQLLEGLKFLHDNNVLHRDIKPQNILVDHQGRLKLTDFGLSRHLSSINPTTRPCGTPHYMAPETVSKGKFGVGSDIWALAATLAELFTGELPWTHLNVEKRENNYALMFHIGQLAGQRGHHPHIPSDLSDAAKDFFLTCFAPDPQDRTTCDQLLAHPWLQPTVLNTPVTHDAAHTGRTLHTEEDGVTDCGTNSQPLQFLTHSGLSHVDDLCNELSAQEDDDDEDSLAPFMYSSTSIVGSCESRERLVATPCS